MALSFGNKNANTLVGFAADDAIFGFGGNDILLGFGGNDGISGGGGDDEIDVLGAKGLIARIARMSCPQPATAASGAGSAPAPGWPSRGTRTAA